MENRHDARWHRTFICPSESVRIKKKNHVVMELIFCFILRWFFRWMEGRTMLISYLWGAAVLKRSSLLLYQNGPPNLNHQTLKIRVCDNQTCKISKLGFSKRVQSCHLLNFTLHPWRLGSWKETIWGFRDTRECFQWQHITQGCLESVHHNHRGNTFTLMDKQVQLKLYWI